MKHIKLDKALLNEIVERWSRRTAQQAEEVPRLPLDVLLGEVVDVAAVIENNFKTTVVGGKIRPGLDSVAGNSGVTVETATELRELQAAVSEVQQRYLSLADATSPGSVERADELLSEFRAVLGFLLENGENSTGEAQLARLREQYDDAHSHDAIALALEGYAELASQYQEDIAGLGGVDEELIPEALEVARDLRQRSADRLAGKIAQEQRDLMKLRNRLIGALNERVSRARRTVRFVFRSEPEIIRKVSSEYSRNMKRKARSKSSSDISTSSITGTEDTIEAATPAKEVG